MSSKGEVINVFSKEVLSTKDYNFLKLIFAMIFDAASSTANVVIPLLLMEKLSSMPNPNEDKTPILISAGSLLIAQVLPKLSRHLVNEIKNSVQENLTNLMVKKVFDLELDQMITTPTSDFAQVINKNYTTIAQLLPALFSEILPFSLETIISSIILCARYGSVGGFQLGIFTLFLAANIFGEQQIQEVKQESLIQSYITYDVILKAIGNYQIAKQFGNSDYEMNKAANSLMVSKTKFNNTSAKEDRNTVLLALFNGLGFIGSLLYIVMNNHTIHLFDFALIAYYFTRFNANLNVFPNSLNTLHTAFLDAEKLTGFLKRQPQVIDLPNAQTLIINQAPRIEFKNVSFSYQNTPILDNVSFMIEPGAKVCIVGPTNSGKSTIVKLLFRFYQPSSGEILINGVNINHYTMDSVRKNIAMISQDSLVFEDTLANNIRYGDLSATDRDVEKAASLAELIDPNTVSKLQVLAGQNGSMLSGGERQRTTIARALLKEACLFLLDEPTSALDANTEKEVQSLLDGLTNKGTTILVTHRLHTTYNSNCILYMENGKIAERGTFSELRALNGKFNNQFNTFCREIGIDPNAVSSTTTDSQQVNQKFRDLHRFWQERRITNRDLVTITPTEESESTPLLSPHN